MASRHALGQGLQLLGHAVGMVPASRVALQAARLISTSASQLWPDVLMPSMGESMKEGTIAAVLKQVGQPVREDEVIAQVETDKVTIDVKSPAAGVLQQILIKPSDTVVPGQLVAIVGAGAAAAAPSTPAAAGAPAAAPVAASAHAASGSGRTPMIQFPPRVTAKGERISDLSADQYSAAVKAATAASQPAAPQPAAAAAPAAPAAPAVPAVAPAAQEWPMPAAKAAPPPIVKNRLAYVTRPDGRGGPPRRPLTERELDMINMGGVY